MEYCVEIDRECGIPVILGEVKQRTATVDAGIVARTSIRPCAATTSSTSRAHASPLVMSTACAPAAKPRSRSPSATAVASDSLTSQTATRAPSDARRSQIAAPIPPPPPVTIATAFRNRSTLVSSLGELRRRSFTRPPTCWDWADAVSVLTPDVAQITTAILSNNQTICASGNNNLRSAACSVVIVGRRETANAAVLVRLPRRRRQSTHRTTDWVWSTCHHAS